MITAPRTLTMRTGDATLPPVSLVIPMRNEKRSIAGCLDALLAQRYPRELVEILVVDGHSNDGSAEIVRRYAARDGRIRLLDNPSGAIPAGLNIGIRHSRGDVIARIDARSRPREDYLATGIRLLQETGASNVGGQVRFATPVLLGRILAAAQESRFGMGGAAVRYRGGNAQDLDTVYLGMYPRAVFETIGLYDEEMLRDQDDEFNFRLRARGGRVIQSAAMAVDYLNAPSFSRFLRQQFLYGFWKVRVAQKHPSMTSIRHWIPPAFTLGVLATPVVTLARPSLLPLVGAAASVYAACAIGAGLSSRRRTGWRVAVSLPFVIFLMHVTWGLGFLAGLVRFMPRWFRDPAVPPRLAATSTSTVETRS